MTVLEMVAAVFPRKPAKTAPCSECGTIRATSDMVTSHSGYFCNEDEEEEHWQRHQW